MLRDFKEGLTHGNFISVAQNFVYGCLERNAVLGGIIKPDTVSEVVAGTGLNTGRNLLLAVEHLRCAWKGPFRVYTYALQHTFPHGGCNASFGEILPRYRERDCSQAASANESDRSESDN